MKRSIYLLVLMLLCVIARAQDNMAVSVVMPTIANELNESQLSKLESRIRAVVTQNGVVAVDYAPLTIHPKFGITNISTSEADVTKITVVTCSFTMEVKQWPGNTVITTFEQTLTGKGDTKDDAIVNALRGIRSSDPAITRFVADLKSKVATFYSGNCDRLMTEARSAAAKNQYEEALALSMSIPAGISGCSAEAKTTTLDLYAGYQERACKGILIKAQAKAAKHDYAGSIEDLGLVDPKSPCAVEAQKLVKEMGPKLNDELKRRLDAVAKTYSDPALLEKVRQKNAEKIAITYMLNHRR